MRIAIIGGGISGLGAAWLLGRRHDVRLFEAAPWIGGHTHTIRVRHGGREVALDTGFMVFNRVTYPRLARLFDALGVESQDADMSFSVQCACCALEYSGRGLGGVFAQRRNLARPSFHAMLADIARFNRLGCRLVETGALPSLTLDRFLDEHAFGRSFARHYLIPMAAALWSSGTRAVGRFPVESLLRFFHNHGFFRRYRVRWQTLVGGSDTYVRAMLRDLPGRVHPSTPVARLERGTGGVRVHFATGGSQAFDAAVVATHADQALAILDRPSPAERELLSAWEYARNDTVLHTDASRLPRRERARAAWNYRLADCERGAEAASISYHLNRLQRLDEPDDFVVTLNARRPFRPDLVLARMAYTHPVFTPESLSTQPDLPTLGGRRRTWYCGAYFGYGFHEDGFASAVRMADALGVGWS